MKPLTPQELEAKLRAIGAQRYHRLHPFHALLHGGKCTKGQVQAWALNRYYYQAMIPVKDASLIARCTDSTLRREWLQGAICGALDTRPLSSNPVFLSLIFLSRFPLHGCPFAPHLKIWKLARR